MINDQLKQHIAKTYMHGDGNGLTEVTPLLGLNIIDSSRLFELVHFIGSEFAVKIPFDQIVPENFESIGTIEPDHAVEGRERVTEEMIRSNALRVLCAQVQQEPQHVVLESHLEGELRIDETGLAGVLAALRAEFGLPADALSARFVTVREVLDEVVVSAATGQRPGPPAPPPPPAPPAAETHGDHRDIVLEVFRHHTHYAANQLRPDADLEGELGVDSVLLASILGDLGKRLGLAKGAFKAGTVRTIDDVLVALRRMSPVDPRWQRPRHRHAPGEVARRCRSAGGPRR